MEDMIREFAKADISKINKLIRFTELKLKHLKYERKNLERKLSKLFNDKINKPFIASNNEDYNYTYNSKSSLFLMVSRLGKNIDKIMSDLVKYATLRRSLSTLHKDYAETIESLNMLNKLKNIKLEMNSKRR